MDALEAKITALEKKEAEFQQNIKEIEEKPHRDEDDRAKLASLRRSLQAVEGRLAAVEQQITHHTAILAEEKKLMAHLMISGQRGSNATRSDGTGQAKPKRGGTKNSYTLADVIRSVLFPSPRQRKHM